MPQQLTMPAEHSKQKSALQKGFTFVELLVIMVIIAIIGGIGIQFVLSTQEDKAKLTNARTFLGKDIPTALFSCMTRKGDVEDCTKTTLLKENIKTSTEWDESWSVEVATTSVGRERVIVCYPLSTLGKDTDSIGQDLFEYLQEKTTWGQPDQGQFAYLSDTAATTNGRTSNASYTLVTADNGVTSSATNRWGNSETGATATAYCDTEFDNGGKSGFVMQYEMRR